MAGVARGAEPEPGDPDHHREPARPGADGWSPGAPAAGVDGPPNDPARPPADPPRVVRPVSTPVSGTPIVPLPGEPGSPSPHRGRRRRRPIGGSAPQEPGPAAQRSSSASPSPSAASGSTGRPTGEATLRTGTGASGAVVVRPPGAPPWFGPDNDWISRTFGGHDIDGPRVRLGLLWLAIEIAALVLGGLWGAVPLAVVFACVGAVAALQATREWRRAGRQPSRLVAGLGGLALPLAALYGTALTGAVVIAVVVAALVAALFRRRRRTPWLGAAGTTVRSTVFIALTGAWIVLTYRESVAGVVVLIVLVTAYDMGDFALGTEAGSPVAGPAGGMIAVAVFTFTVAVFQVSPFDSPAHAALFGALVAVLSPLSQMVTSLLLPQAWSWAPAVRRVDTLVLTGPAWLWLLWRYLG